MKLTSKEARNILEIERKTAKNDRWIEHFICVGDTAGIIAQASKEKGYDVDIDKTITLGYLHDIGKYNGESHGHEISGYNYLQGGKVFTIDKRLIDIMIRRGAYSNTQYHIKETYKLKEYFDSLLGYNLYDLFPEIKNNL